jgi:hypothetical protein
VLRFFKLQISALIWSSRFTPRAIKIITAITFMSSSLSANAPKINPSNHAGSNVNLDKLNPERLLIKDIKGIWAGPRGSPIYF